MSSLGAASSDKFVEHCAKNYIDKNINKIRCLECIDEYLLVSGKCLEISID